MLLALIVFPTLGMLAGLALVVLADPNDRIRLVIPAIRTVALLTAATIYVGALFHYGAH